MAHSGKQTTSKSNYNQLKTRRKTCKHHPLSMNSRICKPVLIALLFTSCITLVQPHVIMASPRQRGALAVGEGSLLANFDASAPLDPRPHFPAGNKGLEPGAARQSLERAGRHVWTEFEPLRPGFKWRSGVCGDELGQSQDHTRGGKYFGKGATVQRYGKGATIGITMDIVMHHLGFFEFHICDANRCGGDISEKCFANGHCQMLERAPSYCDSGKHMACGPIDRNYPGRFYMPCHGNGSKASNDEEFLLTTMQYKLPSTWTCENCVIQMHYTTGFRCNAGGVVDYFDGPDRPKWGTCAGNAGAIGGISRSQKSCGGDLFAEEYLQCADVAIGDVKPQVTPTPTRGPRVTPKPDRNTELTLAETGRSTTFRDEKLYAARLQGPWVTPTPVRDVQGSKDRTAYGASNDENKRAPQISVQRKSQTRDTNHEILKREQATGVTQLKLASSVSVATGRMTSQRHGHTHDVGLLVDVLRNSGTRGGIGSRRLAPIGIPSAFRRKILLEEISHA